MNDAKSRGGRIVFTPLSDAAVVDRLIGYGEQTLRILPEWDHYRTSPDKPGALDRFCDLERAANNAVRQFELLWTPRGVAIVKACSRDPERVVHAVEQWLVAVHSLGADRAAASRDRWPAAEAELRTVRRLVAIAANDPPDTTKHDQKNDHPKKPEKKRRIRAMSAAAADCARRYRAAGGQFPMKDVVQDYVAEHGGSVASLMRVLSDNPVHWRDDQKPTK